MTCHLTYLIYPAEQRKATGYFTPGEKKEKKKERERKGTHTCV
jgi:hypothetical protein